MGSRRGAARRLIGSVLSDWTRSEATSLYLLPNSAAAGATPRRPNLPVHRPPLSTAEPTLILPGRAPAVIDPLVSTRQPGSTFSSSHSQLHHLRIQPGSLSAQGRCHPVRSAFSPPVSSISRAATLDFPGKPSCRKSGSSSVEGLRIEVRVQSTLSLPLTSISGGATLDSPRKATFSEAGIF